VTALLQSSTATGLMMTSFAARGLVDLVPALAVMLGANIGTTLIVQAFSFDISAVAPILFVAGLLAFNLGGRTRTHDLGRVAIGLGLMLLSLHVLLNTLAAAENAPSMRVLCRDCRRSSAVRNDRCRACVGGPFQRRGGATRHGTSSHVRRTDSRATSLSTFFISWASSTTIMSAPKPVRLENDMARRSPPAKLLNSSIWSRSSRHCTPQRAWYHSLDTNLRQASLCSLES
jgi:hypothetical protein